MLPSSNNDKCWWEGYDGQSVVIMDDFYGKSITIDDFKRWVDKYPCKVNIKNGSSQLLARRIYVTSNAGWKTWWGADLLANSNNQAAIERRITYEGFFNIKYVAPNASQGEPSILDTDVGDIIDFGVQPSTGNFGNPLICEEDDEFLNESQLSPLGAKYEEHLPAAKRARTGLNWNFNFNANQEQDVINID